MAAGYPTRRGSLAHRRDVLQRASDMLQARFNATKATVVAGQGQRLHARLEWPGIVVVTDFYTGQELARSLPGNPTEVDLTL